MLLSQHSRAVWLPFLKDLFAGDGASAKDLNSILTFGSLHNSHLALSRLLKLCLIQYLPSDEISSVFGGWAAKRIRFSLV